MDCEQLRVYLEAIPTGIATILEETKRSAVCSLLLMGITIREDEKNFSILFARRYTKLIFKYREEEEKFPLQTDIN